MNFEELYNQLVTDFKLEELPQEEREEVLIEVSKTIQKQFLFDIYDIRPSTLIELTPQFRVDLKFVMVGNNSFGILI